MSIYLGDSGKRKIIWNGVVYLLNVNMASIAANSMLLSFDDYILTDVDEVYLIPDITY